MKIKNTFYFSLWAFALLVLISGCANNAVTIPVTVNFGTTPKGGGPCSGKGVCSSVAQEPGATATSGIAVTMQISPKDKGMLTMTFSMAELKQKQPEQAANFTDGGSYNFDAPYDLGDKMYAPLGLAARARIEPTSKSTVSIKGDVVTVTYTYAHE